jgi:hypothetical protein
MSLYRKIRAIARRDADTARWLSGVLAIAIATKTLVFPYLQRDKGPAIRILSAEVLQGTSPDKGLLLIEYKKLRFCSMNDATVEIVDIQDRTWGISHNIRTMSLEPTDVKKTRFILEFEADFSLPSFRSGTVQFAYNNCTDGPNPKLPVITSIIYQRSED